MGETLLIILLYLFLLIGVVMIMMNLPGLWVIWGSTLIYGGITGFVRLTGGLILGMLVLGVLAEAVEFVSGALASRKFGASKWGMFGAIIGAIVGAIWGTVMFPLIGTLVGAFAGAFAGALVLEYLKTSDVQNAMRAGLGALVGWVFGFITKVVAGITMIVMITSHLF